MQKIITKKVGKPDLTKVREYLLKALRREAPHLVATTATQFGVTTVTIQNVLRKMVEEGLVKKIGGTKGTRWVIVEGDTWKKTFTITANLSEDQVWVDWLEPVLRGKVHQNIFEILRYGFTEMLNNVVDHSFGKMVSIHVHRHRGQIEIVIQDDGVGIFHKISREFNLMNSRESILELSKGKVTTSPERHSGEGIFFTSRVFDLFEIISDGFAYRKNNLIDDWAIATAGDENTRGTTVRLVLSESSSRILQAVFIDYTDPESFAFEKTEILVKLAENSETDFISRSQAKRVLHGLEKFRTIIFDFRNVNTVGQGFVDETFRVFKNSYPYIQLKYTNANENVQFMIERGLQTRV